MSKENVKRVREIIHVCICMYLIRFLLLIAKLSQIKVEMTIIILYREINQVKKATS